MIKCLECGREFTSVVSHQHLKKVHKMTTRDYRDKHGEDSMSTPEYRLKMSEINKEIHNRPEVRLRSVITSTLLWQNQKLREQIQASMREAWSHPEVRENQSQIQKEVQNRPEVRANKSEKVLFYWQDPERRAQHSKKQKEVHGTPEARKANSERNKAYRATHPEDAKKHSIFMKAKWAEPEYRMKTLRAQARGLSGKLSSIHLKFKEALDQAGLIDFESEQCLNGLMRCDEVDWVHNIVLEVNGCYWHNCSICFPEGYPLKDKRVVSSLKRYEKKREYIKQHPDLILIEVWEHDLKDPARLQKIIEQIEAIVKK